MHLNQRHLHSKSEIGPELGGVLIQAEQSMNSLDRNKAIVLSLSAMSGLNDTYTGLLRDWTGITEDPLRSMALTYLTAWRTSIELILMFAYYNLKPSSVNPGQPPGIRFIFTICPYDEFDAIMRISIEAGEFDVEKDLISVTRFVVGDRPGQIAFIALDSLNGPWERFVKEWLDVRQLNSDAIRITEALGTSRSMTVDDAGLHHPVPQDVDYNSMIGELARGTYRSSGHFLPHKWATDLTEVSRSTVETAHIGKGSLNRMHLKREQETVRQGFLSLPGYSEAFEGFMGLEFDEFLALTSEISMLGYPKSSCVCIGRPQNIIKKLSKKTGLDKRTVTQHLDTMDEFGRQSIFRPILRLSPSLWATSYDWASTYRLEALNCCFYGPYEFDLRGKAFEQRCRSRLLEEGYLVSADRIPVAYPKALIEEFETTFGFKKSKTDFDLIAQRNQVLIIAECKELKPRLSKPMKRKVISHLRSRQEQLEFLTRWMASSRSNMLDLIPQHLLLEVGIEHFDNLMLLPLFFVNFDPELPEQGVLVVRFEQLKDIGNLADDIEKHIQCKIHEPRVELLFSVCGRERTVTVYPLRHGR